MKSREIRLKTRPAGLPNADNFQVVEVDLPDPADGEVLVENIWMSVDPYMRGRMDKGDSYIPAFELDEAMSGGAIGRVIASKHPEFPIGTLVESMFGWREHFVHRCGGSEEMLGPEGVLQRRDPELVPPQTYLGVAGMPGFTAYVGLLTVGALKQGETVFISAAAGAVGSAACQIAKRQDCRVIGSAGNDEKTTWLVNEAGVDVCINYKESSNLQATLETACPEGIDVYFENVGGKHLDAALASMNEGGRIVVCGLISQYNTTGSVDGPQNFFEVLVKSLTVRGFIVTNYLDQQPEFLQKMARWIDDGNVKWQETVYEGIDRAPDALLALFSGTNNGKMLVKLA